jgi:uncharacterized membrane protein
MEIIKEHIISFILSVIGTSKNLASAIFTRLKEEPVLVRSILALAVSLGFVNLTDVQIDYINQIVIVVLVLSGSVAARKIVTPLTPEQIKKQKTQKKVKRQTAKISKAQKKIRKAKASRNQASPHQNKPNRKAVK